MILDVDSYVMALGVSGQGFLQVVSHSVDANPVPASQMSEENLHKVVQIMEDAVKELKKLEQKMHDDHVRKTFDATYLTFDDYKKKMTPFLEKMGNPSEERLQEMYEKSREAGFRQFKMKMEDGGDPGRAV